MIKPQAPATECQPPLGISDEVRAYLGSLQAGDRVIECGVSGLAGRLGTVYISDKEGQTKGSVCVLWDKVGNETGQMGSTVTWGSRRIADSGSFREYAEAYESQGEPDASDGCDKDSFASGCERAGHTPDNCPGFQIGDTVRFAERHIAAGDIGVIVGRECWLNNHEATVWDGCGEIPARVKRPHDYSLDPEQLGRFLVRLQDFNPDTRGSTIGGLDGWRNRCLQYPHDYPFCAARDLELVSRPEIKVLNDSGCLGSVLGLDRDARTACVSDSEAGARKAIAMAKASACIALRHDGPPEGGKFFAREETDTKVADELHVGFQLWLVTVLGTIEATVTSVDDNSAVVESGGLKANLMRKADGWYDTHRLVNPECMSKAVFVRFDQEVAGE